MASIVTKSARRARRAFGARASSLKFWKHKTHRKNRRTVHTYTDAIVKNREAQATKLEGKLDRPRLTSWEVS